MISSRLKGLETPSSFQKTAGPVHGFYVQRWLEVPSVGGDKGRHVAVDNVVGVVFPRGVVPAGEIGLSFASREDSDVFGQMMVKRAVERLYGNRTGCLEADVLIMSMDTGIGATRTDCFDLVR